MPIGVVESSNGLLNNDFGGVEGDSLSGALNDFESSGFSGWVVVESTEDVDGKDVAGFDNDPIDSVFFISPNNDPPEALGIGNMLEEGSDAPAVLSPVFFVPNSEVPNSGGAAAFASAAVSGAEDVGGDSFDGEENSEVWVEGGKTGFEPKRDGVASGADLAPKSEGVPADAVFSGFGDSDFGAELKIDASDADWNGNLGAEVSAGESFAGAEVLIDVSGLLEAPNKEPDVAGDEKRDAEDTPKLVEEEKELGCVSIEFSKRALATGGCEPNKDFCGEGFFTSGDICMSSFAFSLSSVCGVWFTVELPNNDPDGAVDEPNTEVTEDVALVGFCPKSDVEFVTGEPNKFDVDVLGLVVLSDREPDELCVGIPRPDV